MNNFNYIVNKILKSIYVFLCFLTFRNKSKYIFYSFPDASDNSFYLYKYIASKNKNFTFVWLCDEPDDVLDRLRMYVEDNKLIVIKKRSIEGVFHFCTSKYAFTTTNFYPFFVKGWGPIVVGVWHGMPIKVIGSYKENISGSYFDYMISTSDLYSKVISYAFLIDKVKVLPHGLPRNDGLLNISSSAKNKICEHFSIKSDSKIVFWLPTYRKSFDKYGHNDSENNSFIDEWDVDFFNRLNGWALSVNTVILIKIHPADSYNDCKYIASFDCLKFVKAQEWQDFGVDLYEALSISDGLISDVSSVIIDYMIVKKPVAILKNSIDCYSRAIIPEVSSVLEDFFSVNSEEDFKFFIENLKYIRMPSERIYLKYNKQALTRESSCELISNSLKL